jgi:hypothetical protein
MSVLGYPRATGLCKEYRPPPTVIILPGYLSSELLKVEWACRHSPVLRG